jgi:hypothetical protein
LLKERLKDTIPAFLSILSISTVIFWSATEKMYNKQTEARTKNKGQNPGLSSCDFCPSGWPTGGGGGDLYNTNSLGNGLAQDLPQKQLKHTVS